MEERSILERAKGVDLSDACKCNSKQDVVCWRHKRIAEVIDQAIKETKESCAQKIRGAVPMPFHVKAGNEAGISFVAEMLFRIADEVEGKERKK